MDPLSDVLSLLKLRSFMAGGFAAGGDWAIKFPPYDGIKFYAVISGECWLSAEGLSEPLHVAAGDCYLLPRGRSLCIASDLAVTPVDAFTIFSSVSDGGIRTYKGGGDFLSVGGHFSLAGDYADILLKMLPPIVHIRKESDKAVLHWCAERMRQELRDPQPGGFLVAQQLATMMLVQGLRLHLAERTEGGVGWLFALADKQMAAAIAAMHKNPAHRWTLQLLAEHVGMSRTSFALRFKETVGSSPMEYLTRWRMLLAGHKLANTNEPVSLIALSVGYESESAFSTAFKRAMGCSPRQYGRGRTRALAPHDEGERAALPLAVNG